MRGNPRDAYDALERKTRGAVRGSLFNDSNLSQSIILGALTSESYQQEKEKTLSTMINRASRLKNVLASTKYDHSWEAYPFNSGYFMCLKLKTVDPEELRLHLLDNFGVGVIALGKTDIRVAFSCIEEEDISELFDLIYQGVKDLEKGSPTKNNVRSLRHAPKGGSGSWRQIALEG